MISELTKVPFGWEKVKFGDIVKNITDRINNPKESNLKNYIGLEHLDTDEIRIKRYGSPDEVEATKFLCKKGDIIFGKRRAYLRKLAVTDRDAVVSAHSMILRPIEEKVHSQFLPWFMQTTQFWKTAFAISEGSLSPTIKWKTLSAQEFWLPSLNEQRKISEILMSIEMNIERLEEFIKIAEKLNKGLLEKLLTRGIGYKKFKETKIGQIPVTWQVVDFENYVELRHGYAFKNDDFAEKGLKVLKIEQIKKEGRIDLSNCSCIDDSRAPEFKNEMVKNGDILMALTGATLGKSCRVEGIKEIVLQNQRVGNFFPKDEKILLKDFLYFLLNSESILSQIFEKVHAAAQANIGKEDFRKTKFPLPSLDEQKRIVKILNEINEEIAHYKIHLYNLARLKKRLLDLFVSGELLIPKEAMNCIDV